MLYYIIFYFILFYFILFYFILFYFILFYFILFYYIRWYFLLSKKERLMSVKFSTNCDLQIERQSENIDSSKKRKVRILLRHNFSYRIMHNMTYA